MKIFRNALAILMVTALIMGLTAISASAATVTGSTVNFTKYMVVDSDTIIPNTTISFSITPGTAIEADSNHMSVYAGPEGAAVGSVTFAPTDATYNDVQTGDDITLESGKKYAKQTAAVDLSGVTFTEPGVYRYNLTEADPADNAITKDSRTLYLDVYVTSIGNDLAVSSTVLHTDSSAPSKNANGGSGDVSNENDAVSDKVTGFTNSYSTQDLTFSKTVSGNQASKDKYFAFTVTIDNVTAGNKYTVDLNNADSSISANPNAATTCITADVAQPAELTVGADGNVTQVFYIHDGQSIDILGLPKYAEYTVAEAEEDYTPSVNGINSNQTNGTIDVDNVTTAFTNTRDGIIPTGILLTVAPFAVGILLFGSIIIFMIAKRRRESY